MAIGFALVTLVVVGGISRYAALVLILDGVRAATVTLPWALAGLWIVPLLRLGSLPLRWHLLLGFGLGLGAASLAVLLLGSFGTLHRGLWITLLCIAFLTGLVRLALLLNAAYLRGKVFTLRPTRLSFAWRLSVFLLLPFAIMAILAATTPSGLIWAEEGFGYDILEYHLQVPTEYLNAGRVSYLPHNVYANFPSNVEMLYLLAMVVYPDVREVSTIANMVHVLLGVLAVFAAWVAGRQSSPQAGMIGAVAAGTSGWLVYLGGLAYVENGLLFFGMASAACLTRAYAPATSRGAVAKPPLSGEAALPARLGESIRPAGAAPRARTFRCLAAAGALAGFACGCKYTGFGFVALPLVVAIFVLSQSAWRLRCLHACVFLLASLVCVSPWLVRNVINTGNPVFPLANGLFHGAPPGWTEEGTNHWDTAHRPHTGDAALSSRTSLLLKHTLLDPDQRLNMAAVFLGLAGLLWRRPERTDTGLALILGVQLVVWLAATHLYARFLTPVIIPSVLLAVRSLPADGAPAMRRGILLFLSAAAVWYAAFSARLMQREWPGALPAAVVYHGQIPAYEHFGWINDLPADAKVLSVGEARAFYLPPFVDYWTTFNRHPFLEEVQRLHAEGGRNAVREPASDEGADLLAWLRRRGYTHLLVNWAEVRRLAGTYGFSPPVTEQHIRDALAKLERAGMTRIEPVGEQPSASALYVIPPA